MPANCAEISKVTSGGGNWILRDFGPPEAKAFDLKYSSCIRLWNTTMKNWLRHHLENFISFPLIYRFAGIRRVWRVLTELEADHWKHQSNYTVTLNQSEYSLAIYVNLARFWSTRKKPLKVSRQTLVCLFVWATPFGKVNSILLACLL